MTNRLLTLALLVFLAVPGTAIAQTPDASPDASPVSGDAAWTITDSRKIEVEGEPIAMSPDGNWLAGIGAEENTVCLWDMETLTPSCVDVGGSIEAFLGGMRLTWAPDSSAFAFVSGSIRRLEYGEVFVYEVGSDELIQLTDFSSTGIQQLYIGTAWTADSQHIVVGLPDMAGKESPQPAIGRIDRASGDMEVIPLTGNWSNVFSLRTPPWVGEDGSVFIAVTSDGDSGGVWRLAPDGSDMEKLVGASEERGVVMPVIVSGSSDGRYLNVVSMVKLSVGQFEDTFFLLDTETGALTAFEYPDSLPLIVFAPDNETGLTEITVGGTNRLHTIDLASGEISPVENSPEVSAWLAHIPTWSTNNTVFLPSRDEGTLVTLEPVR